MADNPGQPDVEDALVRLLESLRVLLPGIQVLLGFLLTVPYSSRFKSAGLAEQILLTTTLAAAMLSVVLLLAPLAAYRLAPDEVEAARLRRWNRLVLAGLFFLALTLAGAMPTVLLIIWDTTWVPIVAGTVTLACIVAAWLLLPALRRHRAAGG